MEEVYYLLIKNGLQNFDSIPDKYKPAVNALLEKDKLETEG